MNFCFYVGNSHYYSSSVPFCSQRSHEVPYDGATGLEMEHRHGESICSCSKLTRFVGRAFVSNITDNQLCWYVAICLEALILVCFHTNTLIRWCCSGLPSPVSLVTKPCRLAHICSLNCYEIFFLPAILLFIPVLFAQCFSLLSVLCASALLQRNLAMEQRVQEHSAVLLYSCTECNHSRQRYWFVLLEF